MNTTIEPGWWIQLFGVLAVEAVLLVGLVLWIEGRLASAVWKRTLWQGCLLALPALVAGEVTGVGHGLFGLWRGTRTAAPMAPAVGRAEVRVATSPAAAVPVAVRLPQPAAVRSPVWWPGLLWLGGIGLVLARALGARANLWVRSWRRGEPVSAELLERVQDVAGRLGIQRPVRVSARGGLAGPVAFGVVRPVVCVPPDFGMQFTPGQQEAILAHELAHIARRDALMNAFQTLVECLLFYHTAVWWVSRRLREEREHCCDDLAVAVCGDRLEYSRALLALEETRSAWMMAVGA